MNTRLSLDWLRCIRVVVCDRKGQELTTRKFQWFVNQRMPNGFEYICWGLKFDVQRWEWGIVLGAEGWNNFDKGNWIMWLHNYDPNRFLVGIELECQEDLLRWLEAFRLEYRVLPLDEANLQPLEYLVKDGAK